MYVHFLHFTEAENEVQSELLCLVGGRTRILARSNCMVHLYFIPVILLYPQGPCTGYLGLML